jgi:AraC-like DNA-binding protein
MKKAGPPPPATASEFLGRLPDPGVLLQLFDHLPRVYLFVKDREHRFMKVNRGLLALHGCTRESEMIGRTDFDFHPPALATQYVDEDCKVMESRRPLLDQLWLVPGADGMPRWYLSTKLPLINARGEVIGIAGVLRPYDQEGEVPGESRRLTAAFQFVLSHFGERITVTEMARRAHLSVSQLQREFQRLFGMAPSEYVLRVRLLAARRQLEQTRDSVGQIALGCGFYDQSHFTRAFRSATGLRPLEYRRRFAPQSGKGSEAVPSAGGRAFARHARPAPREFSQRRGRKVAD